MAEALLEGVDSTDDDAWTLLDTMAEDGVWVFDVAIDEEVVSALDTDDTS